PRLPSCRLGDRLLSPRPLSLVRRLAPPSARTMVFSGPPVSPFLMPRTLSPGHQALAPFGTDSRNVTKAQPKDNQLEGSHEQEARQREIRNHTTRDAEVFRAGPGWAGR